MRGEKENAQIWYFFNTECTETAQLLGVFGFRAVENEN